MSESEMSIQEIAVKNSPAAASVASSFDVQQKISEGEIVIQEKAVKDLPTAVSVPTFAEITKAEKKLDNTPEKRKVRQIEPSIQKKRGVYKTYRQENFDEDAVIREILESGDTIENISSKYLIPPRTLYSWKKRATQHGKHEAA